MRNDISYAFYGIEKEGIKQGFQIYGNWGFIQKIDKAERYSLFQTPPEIVLLEDEELYSIYIHSDDRINYLFLNHHWYTGVSKGNRNCYYGFSMIIQFTINIPNVLELVQEYINHEYLIKTAGIEIFEEQKKNQISSYNSFNLGNHIRRPKKRSLEFYSSDYPIEGILHNVLDSLVNRNSDKYRIYITTNKELYNRIESSSIKKNDLSQFSEEQSSSFSSQIEQKYNQILSDKTNEITKKENQLLELSNELFQQKIKLKEVSQELEEKIKTYEIKYKELVEKKKEIYHLNRKNLSIKKIIQRNIWIGKNLMFLLRFFRIIIAIIITLAVAIYMR